MVVPAVAVVEVADLAQQLVLGDGEVGSQGGDVIAELVGAASPLGLARHVGPFEHGGQCVVSLWRGVFRRRNDGECVLRSSHFILPCASVPR